MRRFSITALADTRVAEIVAAWQYKEWGSGYDGFELQDFLKNVTKAIGSRGMPLVLVAAIGEDIIGTASLVKDDLPSRQDLNPWLANIFVLPDSRKHGVGTALVQQAIVRASYIGLKEIYLFTHDLEKFYERFGFHSVDLGEFMGKRVCIMRRALA